MPEVDAWERILQLARRIDEAVASRRGVDTDEALQLARAVVSFQQQLASGVVLTSVPDGAEGEERPQTDSSGDAKG